MSPLMICLMPCAGCEYQPIGRPDAAPHFGHASTPSSAKTRLATAICCSRDAAAGFPTPPYRAQVAGLNCSPPYSPFPVLACQLPPDSHCAIASQLGVGAAPATPVDGAIDAATIPPTKAVLTRGLQSLLMSSFSARVSEALPIRITREIRILWHFYGNVIPHVRAQIWREITTIAKHTATGLPAQAHVDTGRRAVVRG